MKKTILTLFLFFGFYSHALAYNVQAEEDLMVFLNRYLHEKQIPMEKPSYLSAHDDAKQIDVIGEIIQSRHLISPAMTYQTNSVAYYDGMVTKGDSPLTVYAFPKPKQGKILLSKSPPKF